MTTVKRTVNALTLILLAVSTGILPAATAEPQLWTPEGTQRVTVADIDLTELAQQFIDQGSYREAANMYASIASISENPDNTLFALVRQADALLMAREYRRALDNYQALADNFPTILPYQHIASNLRVIADAYAAGDAGLFGLTSLGKAREIYNSILEMAPAGANTAADMLHLGRLQEQEGDIDMALETYRTIARRYGGTAEAREARLNRITLLIEESNERIAADHLVRRARNEAQSFIEDYPDTEAAERARTLKEQAEEILGRHLLYLGNFYLRKAHYRPEAAERYLNELLETYPDTVAAADAGEVLDRAENLKQGAAAKASEEASADTPDAESADGGGGAETDAAATPAAGGSAAAEEPGVAAKTAPQPGTVEEMKKRSTLKKWLLPLPSLGLKDDEQE